MAFTNARVIDGTGAAAVEGATIVVSDGKIQAVRVHAQLGPGPGAWAVGGHAEAAEILRRRARRADVDRPP